MSVARARELIDKAVGDRDLLQRFAVLDLKGRGELAAELGYGDCTLDDFQQAAMQIHAEREELTDAELEQVAGGDILLYGLTALAFVMMTVGTAGLSGHLCFLTTACIRARGLPDDCYELETLRAYRDDWLKEQPDGPATIEEYYRIAPLIVAAIDATPTAQATWEGLYERLVLGSVNLIEAGRYQEAHGLYRGIVRELQARYLALVPA
jgi:predicted ribosomally synthesized peptide with nif11-like leader